MDGGWSSPARCPTIFSAFSMSSGRNRKLMIDDCGLKIGIADWDCRLELQIQFANESSIVNLQSAILEASYDRLSRPGVFRRGRQGSPPERPRARHGERAS